MDGLGADPAELGRALHRVLRLHDGGHRRGGGHLARDQDAHRRHADRGAARAAGLPDPGDAARARDHAASGWSRPATSARRSGRRPRTRDDMRLLFEAVAAGLDVSKSRRSPARSSGTSPTPSPGTWWWTTAPRAREPGRATRPDGHPQDALRGLRGRHLGAGGPAPPGAARARCARRATCAGSGARAGCSPRRLARPMSRVRLLSVGALAAAAFVAAGAPSARRHRRRAPPVVAWSRSRVPASPSAVVPERVRTAGEPGRGSARVLLAARGDTRDNEREPGPLRRGEVAGDRQGRPHRDRQRRPQRQVFRAPQPRPVRRDSSDLRAFPHTIRFEACGGAAPGARWTVTRSRSGPGSSCSRRCPPASR